jgi:hypothetical protein
MGHLFAASAGLILERRLVKPAVLFAGGSKIIYDLALHRNFRRLKPSEEQ